MSQGTGLNPDYVVVKSWVKASGYCKGHENNIRSKGAPLLVDFGMGERKPFALCRRHVSFMSSKQSLSLNMVSSTT